MHPDDDERTRAAIIEGELLGRGIVEVVDPDSERETAAWTTCDLAAMVEGCFHRTLDPFQLPESEALPWLDRLADSYEPPDPALDRSLLRYLWLLDDGERAGTIALPRSTLGHVELPIWSLYVHPSRRARGIAGGALRAAHDAARGAGLRGIRVDTHWAWQRSVRFYLRQGMWVVGWKRALSFSWIDSLPPYVLDDEGDRLTLSVLRDGAREPWLTATREGGLAIEEHAEVPVYAHATLALALATRGWPLIRSKAHWARRHASADLGQVEGLAMKIQLFEALARDAGWDVRTPRIPNLAYPPLGAIR